MPQLLSIHMSDIGPPAARFRSVRLPLTDKQSGVEPVDSFIWLRNGGGKGVIKALYYSIFRPSLHEFAGKLSGERRHIRDMVKRTGVAVIATEWTVPGQQPRLDGTRTTRVVGQALAWPGGQYRSDRAPERRFFSFKTDGERVTADALPLRGRANHAASLDAFEAWFAREVQDRPDLEPVWFRDGQQKDWMRFLESCHFDLEGFKIQLQMNRTEGGASQEILSFNREEEFLDVVLQSLLDETGLGDLQEYLKGVREKIQRRPLLEAEVSLFSALKDRLGQVEDRVARRESVQAELDRHRRDIRAIAGTALAHLDVHRHDLEQHERDHAEIAETLAAERESADGAARLAAGARLRRQEIVLEQARRAEADTRERLESLRLKRVYDEAARSIVERRDLESQVRSLRARIQRHSEPKQRKYTALVEAAKAHASRLDAAVADARSRRDSAREEEAQAGTARDEADRARVDADVKVQSLSDEIARIEELLARAERARQTLREVGVLADTESPAAARERHAGRVEALQRRSAEASAAEETARQQAEAKRGEQDAAQRALDAARQRRDEAHRDLEAYRAAHAQLARDPVLLEIQEADEAANPYAPFLVNRLDTRLGELEAERQRRTRERDDARADLEAMDGNDGLLPASREVQGVRAHLADHGVRAFGYPEYLRQQGVDSSEIAELIRRDPARYGGIAVVGRGQFDRAGTAVQDIANLRSPVQITLVSAGDAPELDGRTVVPVHPATYRKEAALELRDELTATCEHSAERLETMEQALDATRATRAELLRFLDTYPEGAEEDLDGARTRAEQDVAEKAETVERLAAEHGELEQARGRHRDTWQACERDLGDVRDALSRLDRHIAAHEEPADESRDRLAAARREHANWRTRAREAQAAAADAGERLERARTTSAGIERELDTLKAELRTVDGYAAGERAPATDTAASREAYESAKAAYEAERGPVELEAELRQVERALDRHQADTAGLFERLKAEGLDPERAEAYAAGLAGKPDTGRMSQREGETRQELGQRTAEREQAERDLDRIARPGELQRPEDCESWTVADCDAAIARFDADHRAAAERISDLAARRDAIAGTIERLKGELQTLRSSVEKAAYILDVDRSELSAGEVARADLDDVAAYDGRIEATNADLQRVRSEMTAATRQLERAVAGVRGELDSSRHEGVASGLKDRMREQLERLDRAAASFREECAEAITAKRSEIDSIETDEADLVRQFDVAVDDLRQKIQKLGPCSRVPDGFGQWSGREFFLVNMNEEVRATESRRAMIRSYIRRLVADEDARIPQSVDLVKACAHAVFDRNLAIKAFKPEMGFPLGRHSMLEILQSSGGEKLTAAVMIYMTLDRLSATYGRGTGGAADDGRTLLLDNPIGPCNLRDFLEFQRSVARSCGIQLLILSGINDPGVVSLYPRVVTVQNLHQDRKTGENVVRVVDDGTGNAVTSATLVFDQTKLDMPGLPDIEAAPGDPPDPR